MRKFKHNKGLFSLSYQKQDIYKIYNQIIRRKALTAFQVNFYKRQELRNYYHIGANFIQSNYLNTILSMEARIDVVLVRMNLVINIDESRQKLASGRVYLNGKVVRSYNYKLLPNDIIIIKDNNMKLNFIMSYVLSTPKNMEVNHKTSTGIYIRNVSVQEISIPFSLS